MKQRNKIKKCIKKQNQKIESRNGIKKLYQKMTKEVFRN